MQITNESGKDIIVNFELYVQELGEKDTFFQKMIEIDGEIYKLIEVQNFVMKKNETKDIKSKNETTHLKNDLHMNYTINEFKNFYQSIGRRTALKHSVVISATKLED